MSTPRWFHPVLAGCAVLATGAVVAASAAAVAHLRYVRLSDTTVLDTWLRAECAPDDCVRVSRTVVPLRKSAHRALDYPPASAPQLP